MSENVIIIPARYESSRFPGKPLIGLRGKDGVVKSLIHRTWEKALAVKGISAIYVATDDDRIADAAKAFGADVVMTSRNCRNGTERCAEALKNLNIAPEIVVNLQGDAPLTPSSFLDQLIDGLTKDVGSDVATPVLRCNSETLTRFVEDRVNGSVGGTTAVFDRNGRALYFSKEVIPYRNPGQTFDPIPVFHHVGVYAYRYTALQKYSGLAEGTLEKLEGLEQLRFLENGLPILCVEMQDDKQEFWEVNNPWDIERVEAAL
ncbi:3-deoxy-manno-octulosonate cytidylyltransferase [Brucella pseudogrignonensis]|uniref:3-deoxy-manno-octulosonate cytidylyltransferase n=1 Tax=Brucella pseudogrignonensis TaxID=419475 RepID=UPI003ECF0883